VLGSGATGSPAPVRDARGRPARRWISPASTALAEGVPISEVSRWLGHKSITTTVDLYGHLVPEASGRARDALDKAFGHISMCPQSAPAAP
jgi:integrase